MASIYDQIKVLEQITDQFNMLYENPAIRLNEDLRSVQALRNSLISPDILALTESAKQLTRPFDTALIQDIAQLHQITAPVQQMIDQINALSQAGMPSSSIMAELLEPTLASLANTSDEANISNEPDFVIVDELPVKEIKISEETEIPVGKCRIKMKTDTFIAIVFGILSLLIQIAPSLPSAQSVAQFVYQGYQSACEWVLSADASHSSQSAFIEELKTSIEEGIEGYSSEAP